MIASLDTSCRVGEPLFLQWHRVRFDLNPPRAEKDEGALTSSPDDSTTPGVAQHAKDGYEAEGHLSTTAFVFGNDETGEPIENMRMALQNCRLRLIAPE